MKLNRVISAFILSIILLSSCGKEKYKGYKQLSSYLYYKLHAFEEGEKRIVKEYVRGDFIITDSSGKVIQYISPYEPLSTDGGSFYEEVYSHLLEGDSATFIFDTSLVLNEILPKKMGDYGKRKIHPPIRLSVNIKQQLDEEQYHSFLHKREMEEQLELKEYISKNKIDSSGYYRGVFVIREKKGSGPVVRRGRVVYMHYRGTFLNHAPFDSTLVENGPFEYTYGTPGQVIKGLELGISKLREGDKAKIIIPSQLAFGEDGSSTGIVPPYTAVIYNVELKKVK